MIKSKVRSERELRNLVAELLMHSIFLDMEMEVRQLKLTQAHLSATQEEELIDKVNDLYEEQERTHMAVSTLQWALGQLTDSEFCDIIDI